MSEFLEALKTVVIVIAIVNGSLLALFIILMALPGSKLRSFVLKVISGILFTGTGVFLLWVVIPDLIVGPVDDVGALIAAVFSGLGGAFSLFQSKKLPGGKKARLNRKDSYDDNVEDPEESDEPLRKKRRSKIAGKEHASTYGGTPEEKRHYSQNEYEEAEFEELDE